MNKTIKLQDGRNLIGNWGNFFEITFEDENHPLTSFICYKAYRRKHKVFVIANDYKLRFTFKNIKWAKVFIKQFHKAL